MVERLNVHRNYIEYGKKITHKDLEKPWGKEPFSVVKTYKGLPYLILRNVNMFNNLAYVGIPKTMKIIADSELANNLFCHGGITFDTGNPTEEQTLRILGIDAAHYGDYVPRLDSHREQSTPIESYRTVDYMRDECHRMIEQIIDMER